MRRLRTALFGNSRTPPASDVRRGCGGSPLVNSWRVLALCCAAVAMMASAANFTEWQHRQELVAPNAGLVKFSLPPETLDAARADLADLRLADEAGAEVPYRLELPLPTGKVVQAARSFKVELTQGTTVIRLETGLQQPLGAITLVTPANEFIKALTAEGSTDGQNWKSLATGQPVFRQPNGASQLRVTLPPGIWAFLRLTLDDRASLPVPFTGVEVEAAKAEPAPTEPVPLRILERFETPAETRLVLDLGAAHLRLAELAIETPELMFRRPITLSVRQVEENTIREKALAHDSIYRMALAEQPAAARLTVPLDLPMPTRELLLTLQNGDSPPLQISGVRAQRRPVYCVFLAASPGTYQLFTGNAQCAAPRYDLTVPGVELKTATPASLKPGALAANPAYHPSETLPQVQDSGAPLDVKEWRFRKAVKLVQTGVQQLDLDLAVLAGCQSGFADLRLLRDGRQLPYVIERTPFLSAFKPEAARADDPEKPKLSRWSLKLPHARLPVARLTCTSPTPLFRRDMTLYEEATDDRGTKYRHDLGHALWVQSPDRTARTFTLALGATPRTDTLFLETNNEDNPAIELTGFEAACPVTRIFFKTTSTGDTWLYYGNDTAISPQYDLSLVAGQLLGADKRVATLGPEEQLIKPSWADTTRAGKGGVLLWAVLGVVVIALLVIIGRLMPRQGPPAA